MHSESNFCDGNVINIEKADFSMRIQMKLY